MKKNKYIRETPWDKRAIGIETYELLDVSESILKKIVKRSGHFAVKIDPLSPKNKLLYKYGFYYCDTLIQPYCAKESFIFHHNRKAAISESALLKDLVDISHGAFSFGRFHRDFNINKKLADKRYILWLKDLYKSGNVFGLIFDNQLCGYFGFTDNKIVLHAISEKYRGKGLSKYLWSLSCKKLFDRGHKELISSISASNLAAVNLYASLGFKFRNALDVYHLLVK